MESLAALRMKRQLISTQLNPKDIKAQINLAAADLRAFKNEESLVAYQSALQFDPDNPIGFTASPAVTQIWNNTQLPLQPSKE